MELVLRFGGGPPRSYVGCFCGTADGNPTQAAFFDLQAGDPEALMQANAAALFQAVDGTPQIIRGIATTKVPSLFQITNPDPVHLRKADLISANPAFRVRVGQAMAARYVEDPDAPPPPVEKQIYGGFMQRLIAISWPSSSGPTGSGGNRSWIFYPTRVCASLAVGCSLSMRQKP